jgi:putative ABC transport system substrate-binding protein
MNTTRRSLICSVAACAALGPLRALGQQTNKLPRVALVFGAVPVAEMAGADPPNIRARAFVHGLRDLGLVEGRNIIIERRSAEARGPERLAALMQEVVGLGVAVIVTTGSPGSRAAQNATDRIPIVGVVDNALETGLVASLARPGRNFTGIGDNSAAMDGKRLQILKQAAPAISRVAAITYHPLPGPRPKWRIDMDAAARSMGLNVLWLGVNVPEDFEAAFATIVRERADALYVFSTHVNYAQQPRIADFALKHRLPSVGFPETGMLLSYEADFNDMMRRAAGYVKKILDGAKPADLPFEQPTKYALVINMKTARALGLTIPQSLLARADDLIE